MAESIRATLGFLPFLRPSRMIDADSIRRVGRIPVELNYDASAATKVWHPLKLFFLRPISPKPVFSIEECRRETPSQGSTGPGGFELGGFVLTVTVSAQEDARHLQRSLRSGPLRTARIVVDCSLEQYLSAFVTLRCYCIDAEAALRPGKGRHELLLPSSVENRLGAERTMWLTRDQLPSDTVWLVRVPATSCAEPDQGTSEGNGSCFLDPVRLRAFRYLGYATSLLTLVGSIIAGLLETRDERSDCVQQPCELTLGAWSLSLWAVFLLVGAPFCGWHFFQWRRERRWKAAWISRTTRCLADGQEANSGYVSQFMREARKSKKLPGAQDHPACQCESD